MCNRKIGWAIEQPLFQVRDENVITQHLNSLKIPNIWRIKLKKQMPEIDKIVIKRLFMIWIYKINKVKKLVYKKSEATKV